MSLQETRMKSIVLAASLAAVAALCAGCADYPTSNARAMGAGSVNGTVCADGTVLPANSRCVVHGGVAGQARSGSSYSR
jgi:hypothetical protein